MSSDESDSWARYKEEQKLRREIRLPIRTEEIHQLEDYEIQKLSEYQYRINGLIDIYPIHARFHILRKNKRGNYTPGKLKEFLKNNLNP